MGQLKEKMAGDLALRGYKPGTCAEYLRNAEKFAAYYMRSPSAMGADEIRGYLLDVKEKRGLGALKMSVAALKFLYTHTLERPEEVVGIPWPKTPKPLPFLSSHHQNPET